MSAFHLIQLCISGRGKRCVLLFRDVYIYI